MDPQSSTLVDLRSAARWDGFGTAIAGLLALLAGPFVTLLGSVFLVGLVLGPLLILAGIVGLVWGAWGMLFPMSHESMRGLGSNREERESVLREIESELASQVLLSQRLADGAVLSVTPRFFVLHGSGLLLARRQDLLWGYGKVTTHKSYGITTGKTNEICLVSRQRAHTFKSSGSEDAALALAVFSFGNPRAFVGYREDLAALSRVALASKVDSLPAAAGEAPSYSAHPAPTAAQPTHGTAAANAKPGPGPLPWIGVVSGAVIAALGALAAAFFGWVALNGQGPDDLRFGSFFSLACLLACCLPGVLVFALGSWRLYARYGPGRT